jgi:predicted dehydrogenase
MPKSKIRVGILGAGSMGSEHATAYRAVAGVEVAGVFSRTRERAETLAVPPQNSIHAENTGVSRRAAHQMNFPAPP